MDRRTLLKSLPLGAASLAAAGVGLGGLLRRRRDSAWLERFDEVTAGGAESVEMLDPLYDEGSLRPSSLGDVGDTQDRFQKIREFDREFPDDFRLEEGHLDLLMATSARLERAQDLIGHGNFNLLSFERLLDFARNYPEIGQFTPEELGFLEEIFHADASLYGFLGDKVLDEITAETRRSDVKKIPGSGHFIFKGEPLEKFLRIRRDVGDTIRLTSGVRCLAKQYQLFLRKAVETRGNLSQASRSLAPPGYSYHALGDFDIGKVGLGPENFTEAFAETDEYKKMIDLGYVDIRYTETNPFGVRHEPWHIKIG